MAKLKITRSDNTVLFDLEVIVVYSKVYSVKRPNQGILEMLNGSLFVKDRGQSVVIGDIRIKRLSPSQFKQLNDAITESLLFNKWTFTIDGMPDYDMGTGRGNPII